MLTALNTRRRSRGFTLIELAGVVLIIGILAGIAVPTFATLQARNRAAGVESGLDSFSNNLDALAATESRAPNRWDDVDGAVADMPNDANDLTFGVWNTDAGPAAWQAVTGTTPSDGDEISVVRFQQQFGDTFTLGCVFLPPTTSPDAEPFALLNGEEVYAAAGADTDINAEIGAPQWFIDSTHSAGTATWLAFNATNDANPTYVDATATECLADLAAAPATESGGIPLFCTDNTSAAANDAACLAGS